MTTRDYDKDALRVHRDISRCTHTAVCLRHNPAAFDVRSRPSIDVDAATDELIGTAPRAPHSAAGDAARTSHCASAATDYARETTDNGTSQPSQTHAWTDPWWHRP